MVVVHRFGEDLVGEAGEVASETQSACINSERVLVCYHDKFLIFLTFARWSGFSASLHLESTFEEHQDVLTSVQNRMEFNSYFRLSSRSLPSTKLSYQNESTSVRFSVSLEHTIYPSWTPPSRQQPRMCPRRKQQQCML